MGQSARQRIFESRGPKANDRLILLSLADLTPDGCYTCYPSVNTLAEMSGMSDRQAQRVIAGLCEKGQIDRVEGRGRNHTTKYAVLVGLSEEEYVSAMIELKGDIAMSPIPTTKGDIKGDRKHDTAMSPFMREKVTDSEEKVTDRAIKGDIAMSPEQNEQIEQKHVVAANATTAQSEKKPRKPKAEPQSPIEIRRIVATGSQIDLERGLKESRIQVANVAGALWRDYRSPDEPIEAFVIRIRKCGQWIRQTQHPYKNSNQTIPPSALIKFWQAWLDSLTKTAKPYTNGHAPAESIDLAEAARRTGEIARKFPPIVRGSAGGK